MSMVMRALTVRELENLFVPSLRNCTNSKGLKTVHANLVKLSLCRSSFLVTKMIDVCDNVGDSNYAALLFEQVAEPNVFLCNAMIRVHARREMFGLAVSLYQRMLRARHVSLPDRFTFPFVLKSCSGLGCVSLGEQVHAQVVKFGPKSHYMIDNGLLYLYVKCDCLTSAHKVFDEMLDRDVICWNSLLSGYAKAGNMSKARDIFDEMPARSIVSWTAMISGYAGIGCYSAALDVFREMQEFGVEPDEVSLVSVLPACAHLGTLEIGKWIHIYSDRNGLTRSTCVSNALIEMYSKCGCIDSASRVFDQMSKRDVVSWSTMIAGLANHGKGLEAIELFKAMKISGVEPNKITFLGLLSGCVHSGLCVEGFEFFESMKRDYGLDPEVEHYGCLVDLLGRSGVLQKALETVREMPMKPDSKIWGSLLNSCRVYRNAEIALIAMEQLVELEPGDIGNYVLTSNIFADMGMWDRVAEIRKEMRSVCANFRKVPGSSSIEVDSVVQEFVSGDDLRPYVEDLFSMLELLFSNKKVNNFDDIMEIIPEDIKHIY